MEISTYSVMTMGLTQAQIAKFLSVEGSYRVSLVPYVEAYELTDDIANAGVPEDQPEEPQTNYGMGEITTAPPEPQE